MAAVEKGDVVVRITDDTEKSNLEEKQDKSKILNSWKQWMFTGEKKTRFSKTFGLIQSNSVTLRNLIVAVSTYGLERLLNAKAFNCRKRITNSMATRSCSLQLLFSSA